MAAAAQATDFPLGGMTITRVPAQPYGSGAATGGYVPGTYTGAFWTAAPSSSPSMSFSASAFTNNTQGS